jgi:hypothetical protein
MSWLGAIRPTSANDAFDPALWATYLYNNSNNLFYEAVQAMQTAGGRATSSTTTTTRW